ncbi:MAG: RNA pseudouridine synthase [Anaplasmataceae bacterium]|nr:RNA pseudouridine synthase [Anaplasmataceae bacterium]
MTTSEPKIVYEAKDFAVVLKPRGLLMHPYKVPTPTGKKRIKETTLVDWLVKKYPETKNVGDNPEMRPGLVHRLDKETSGLIIIARTAQGFTHFKHLFQSREIKKSYLALVWGEVKKELLLDKPIGLKEGTTRRVVERGKMMKEAITKIKPQTYFFYEKWSLTLVEASPETGRTHQIRVHLASVHHPLIGDPVYGWPERDKHLPVKPLPLMLHAAKLEFSDLRGGRVSLESDPPPGWQDVFAVLESVK